MNSDLAEHVRKAARRTFWGLVIMVIGSVVFDQASKSIAEQHLRLWSDPDDLRMYQGRRILVGLWGAQEESPEGLFFSFAWNYVRNQGAAWGLFSDWPGWFRIPFFYGMTLIAVVIMGMYLRSTPLSHRLARFALALVLSGAVGNFLDRIQHGYVIDFIDCRWNIPLPAFFADLGRLLSNYPSSGSWHYHFPNFNWADACISLGVGLLIFDMLVLDPLRKRRLASE